MKLENIIEICRLNAKIFMYLTKSSLQMLWQSIVTILLWIRIKKTCKLVWEPSKKYLSRQHVTIVEYSGICPRGSVPHGNAKQISQEYVRTDPKIIEEIRDRLNQKQSCSDICKDLAFKDFDRAPRDHQNVGFQRHSSSVSAYFKSCWTTTLL